MKGFGFFPSVMSFSENLCIQLHTRGEKLKLSYLQWMQPQSCTPQHTTFSAVPSVSPTVSWKYMHQPVLCGDPLAVFEQPGISASSWGYEMLRKCCNWGMSSFKLEMSSERMLNRGPVFWVCLVEHVRKESSIKTLRGGWWVWCKMIQESLS